MGEMEAIIEYPAQPRRWDTTLNIHKSKRLLLLVLILFTICNSIAAAGRRGTSGPG